MPEKVVEFQDKQGRKIVGTLIIPDGEGPFPAVIVCHGFKGDRNEVHIKEIAEEISKKDIITLRFDFVKDPGESLLPFEEMTVSYELEVLDQAFNYLKIVPQIDTSKIGLTGHSLGGLVVSWYAAEHPEIKSLVPLSAVYNFVQAFESHYGEWVQEAREKGVGNVFSSRTHQNLKLRREFYDDGASYDTNKVVENINCPVMVLCGTDDRLLSHSQNYLDRLTASDKTLKIIEGANHVYSNPQHLEEVKTAVAEWFAKTLTDKQ